MTTTAEAKNELLMRRLQDRGIEVTWNDAAILRRAETTLRRWFEQECGNSDNYKSWAIERDEKTEIPYMVIYPHTSEKSHRYKINDQEKGARKRIEAICKRLGIYFYIQGDPRGAALYLSKEPIKDSDYTKGVCCSI